MIEGKLKLRTKIAYGMGDIYGGGGATIISMYYMYFLVEVVRLNPALAGTAFLISKIWDAVTDPFMGIISDNTRTRFGRRRPYFLAGIILIFISFVLMWTPVGFQKEGSKFIFVLLAYLFFSTVYTMVMVPYNALATELTSDYDQRTKLSTYRMIFSNIAGILAGVLAKDVFVDVMYKDDPAKGFLVMGVVFGLFFSLPYLATFFFCEEDPEVMNEPKKKVGSVKDFLKGYLVEPLSLRPFRFVVMMYLFGFMAQDAVMAMAIFFLNYSLGISSMMTLLIPVYASMLVAIPVAELVANKIGKKKTYVLSGFLWIAAFCMIPFMHAGMSTKTIYIFGALFGTAAAGIQVMVFAMFPDVPDADELFSGQRREGIFSGIFTFLRKTGGAIVMFFVGNSMQWAGFIPPVDKVVDGVTKTVQQTQTPAFLLVLLLIFILVPVIFIVIAIIACGKYPLTKPVHSRLKNLLKERHAALQAGRELSSEMAEEEKELKRILGG